MIMILILMMTMAAYTCRRIDKELSPTASLSSSLHDNENKKKKAMAMKCGYKN
jgi:hypothetical protein